jgi:hypothetical protein
MLSTKESLAPLLLIVGSPSSLITSRWLEFLQGSPFRVVFLPAVVGDSREDGSSEALVRTIRELQPQLIHSLDLQHASYLCLEAKYSIGAGFPMWMASVLGGELDLLSKLESHVDAICDVMRSVDVLHTECTRDSTKAVQLGFKGSNFPNVPSSGGAPRETFDIVADLPLPSTRDLLVIEGNHGSIGRAQSIILALHRVAPQLRSFRIRVTQTGPATIELVRAVAEEDGLDIQVEPNHATYADYLRLLAQARVAVGCGISGGVGETLLPAMLAGAFPIQSDATCACEWIEPGVSGFVLPAHKPSSFAEAVLLALSDDRLVDSAAVANRRTVVERWSAQNRAPILVKGYQDLLDRAVRERREARV